MSEPTRLQKLNDMRTLLDWLEEHPEVPLPSQIEYGDISITSLNSKDEAAALIRAFGNCEKRWTDDLFYVGKQFGSITLKAAFWRTEICERIVIGTKEVPEKVTPAHSEDIIEWRCSDPLLRDDHAAEVAATAT